MAENKLAEYYAAVAEVYEDKYLEPDLDEDAEAAAEHVSEALANHEVLELGCGTGYWTEAIAENAKSVLATDINPIMLDIAQERDYVLENVEFAEVDWLAPRLPEGRRFTACFGGGMWSHVKREDYGTVLKHIKSAIGTGGFLVLVDDNFVEDVTPPTARTDAEGNTYQMRQLPDGSRMEVLKNFPSDSFLKKKFSAVARDVRLSRNEYFWMLTCVLK